MALGDWQDYLCSEVRMGNHRAVCEAVGKASTLHIIDAKNVTGGEEEGIDGGAGLGCGRAEVAREAPQTSDPNRMVGCDA